MMKFLDIFTRKKKHNLKTIVIAEESVVMTSVESLGQTSNEATNTVRLEHKKAPVEASSKNEESTEVNRRDEKQVESTRRNGEQFKANAKREEQIGPDRRGSDQDLSKTTTTVLSAEEKASNCRDERQLETNGRVKNRIGANKKDEELIEVNRENQEQAETDRKVEERVGDNDRDENQIEDNRGNQQKIGVNGRVGEQGSSEEAETVLTLPLEQKKAPIEANRGDKQQVGYSDRDKNQIGGNRKVEERIDTDRGYEQQVGANGRTENHIGDNRRNQQTIGVNDQDGQQGLSGAAETVLSEQEKAPIEANHNDEQQAGAGGRDENQIGPNHRNEQKVGPNRKVGERIEVNRTDLDEKLGQRFWEQTNRQLVAALDAFKKNQYRSIRKNTLDSTKTLEENLPYGMWKCDFAAYGLRDNITKDEKLQHVCSTLRQLSRNGKADDLIRLTEHDITKIATAHMIARTNVLKKEEEKSYDFHTFFQLTRFERDRIDHRKKPPITQYYAKTRATDFIAKRLKQLRECPYPSPLRYAYEVFEDNLDDILCPDFLFLETFIQHENFRNYEFLTLCGFKQYSCPFFELYT